jgi:hypothetical protein
MEITITKIDAATEQMDWAIRLFIDHQAYLPAITLAGAAEEIVGAILKDRAALSQLAEKFVTDLGMSRADVTQQHLNKAKNWLKHWQDMKDEEALAIDLKEEAIQYIVRALTNLATYDGSWPSEGPRFESWLREHRPELFGPIKT